VLAVGDSTRLEIIFSTKTYRTRVTKRPRITTNEGQEASFVEITAQVTPRPDSTYPIIIGPYKLDLSQYTDKVISEKEFELHNISDQELQIKLIDWAHEYFKVDMPESIKPDQTVRGKIVLKDAALEENFTKSLTFEVNDQKNTRYTIPVKRTVRNVNVPDNNASTSSHQ